VTTPDVAKLRAALFAALLEYSEAKTEARRADAWAGIVRAVNAFERGVVERTTQAAGQKAGAAALKGALERRAKWCPDCMTVHAAGEHTRPQPIRRGGE